MIKKIWQDIKHIIRPWGHTVRSFFYAVLFGIPGRKISTISITGTDGKTTTCMMTYHILKKAGYRVALLTTVWSALPSTGLYRNETKMTTLPPYQLQKFLKKCKEENIDFLILESSSVALHQRRMFGIKPLIAGITNFSREEQQYHRDMDHYQKSKQLILKNTTYAILPTELKGWWKGNPAMAFDYKTLNIKENFLKIKGDYNYLNAKLAIAITQVLGLDLDISVEYLKDFKGVPGRMEQIPCFSGRHIFVDYAVTPFAFETIYQYFKKEYPRSNIIHVFGATGGDRDKGKRPLLGEMASRYANTIILTDEESYGENTQDIINDIKKGIIPNQKLHIYEVPDRKEALKKALRLAKKGDIVVATGMGGELSRNVSSTISSAKTSITSKKMKGGDIPWDESKILEKLAVEVKPTK